MAFKSMYEKVPVRDPKADYQSAVKIGNVRIGKEALYLPSFPMGAQYLPLAALERAWMQKSALATSGCCGVQLPIYVLRVDYGGTFYQNLTFDREQDASRALSLIRGIRPELPGAPEGTAAANESHRLSRGAE